MTVQLDRDLRSIQQVRDLLRQAHEASKTLRKMSQAEVDRICLAMVEAAKRESRRLATLAHEETGFGKIEDKMAKNWVATDLLWQSIQGMKTAGFIGEHPDRGVYEIAEPMGIVAAIIPCTNPTSTAIYKALISVKSRNCVVISPHPSAEKCIAETARVVREAGEAAGLPTGAIGCMSDPTIEGTTELMKHKLTGVILATGGSGIVRAAYSSGTPAYGVGPGNVPAYIDRTADVPQAVDYVVASKTFDWGTLCSSEQSIVADAPVFDQVVAELKRQKAHFMTPTEADQLAKALIQQGGINPKLVGRSPQTLAKAAGFAIAEDARVLIAEPGGVGKEYPLSKEKLSPVLALYKVDGWQAGCELCQKLLSLGGLGHTLALHANDPVVIEQFALEKPAFRILCNTFSTLGSVGGTTGLAPALTLGCGTTGGSITSDNVTPLHLINIKRLAFGVRDREGKPLQQKFEFKPGSAPKAAAASAKAPAGGAPPMSDGDIREIVARYLRAKNL